MKNIAIIDYGSGNLRSVAKAFEKVCELNADDKNFKDSKVTVIKDPFALKEATHIVLPGVGAFGACINGLTSINGMTRILKEEVLENKKPFLGICVGMQLLADIGHEHGEYEGLGWIKGEVKQIITTGLPVPHMGWNELYPEKTDHPLMKGVSSDVYFVHSYQFVPAENDNLVAVTNYGENIAAIIQKDNIYGVQFHPEKSQETGLKIIENFLKVKHAV